MDLKQIMDVAVHAMAERKSPAVREKGFILHHGKRVGQLAVNLRKRVAPDDAREDDIIYVGGLFHDVGKGIARHSDTGAALVRELLKGHCSDEEREAVAEIVRLHNQRVGSEAHSRAAKLVQDADVLDHMGTLEVWLKFLFDAHAEHGPEKAMEYWSGPSFKEDREGIRSLLNYDVSREIFDERRRFEQAFIERFAVEAGGGIV